MLAVTCQWAVAELQPYWAGFNVSGASAFGDYRLVA